MKRYLVSVVVVSPINGDDYVVDFGVENHVVGDFAKRLTLDEIRKHGFKTESGAKRSWAYRDAVECGRDVYVCEVDV